MRIAVAVGVLIGAGHARADIVEPTQEPSPSSPAAAPSPPASPPANITVAGPPGMTPATPPEVARPPSTYSFMVEPLTLAFTTLGVQVERALTQHPTLAVAAHVGAGVTSGVTIGERVHTYYQGDTFAELHERSFLRLHGGLQVNLYFERPFRGPHVGVEALYKHFSPTDGDGDIAVLSGSLYGGWKWITTSGFTATLQFGASLVGKRADEEMTGWPDMTGWERDDEGTLGPAHLFGNFAVGWSI